MLRMRITLAVLASCLLLTQVASGPWRTKVASPSELQLYLSIINKEFTRQGIRPVFLNNKTLDLKDTQLIHGQFLALRNTGYGIPQQLISTFEEVNTKPVQVSQSSLPKDEVVITSEADVREYLKKGKEAGREMPKAIVAIEFSRVAFNSAEDQALVYVSWYCGSECAQHSFLLMRKEQGQWKGEVAGPLIGS